MFKITKNKKPHNGETDMPSLHSCDHPEITDRLPSVKFRKYYLTLLAFLLRRASAAAKKNGFYHAEDIYEIHAKAFQKYKEK